MFQQKKFHFYLTLLLFSLLGITGLSQVQHTAIGKKYFISSTGNDANPGTIGRPWKTVSKVTRLQLYPGDALYFQGGQSFKGPVLLDSLDEGTVAHPILVSSYGKGRAIIDGGNETAVWINKSRHIIIKNIAVKGNGRKAGNTGRGLYLSDARHIELEQVDAGGFQKSGVEIMDGSYIKLRYVDAHDNGYAGIAVTGNHYMKLENRHIYIGYCKAINNPGDPTELNNHSGNGIVVGLSTDVLVEYCLASDNGWDMPRKGNGPVGIWTWESDSVTIQHCISYRNRTAPGAMDGGGFDLDGGVTHALVQYNLAYENEGYGFGIFQYSGATPWHHNTFRYNISFNDGNVTQHGASILWWNGSKDSLQFHDCYFYNNLLYNSNGYVLGVIPNEYDNRRFFFINNIFIGKDELMSGGEIGNERFFGNNWWSIQSKFKVNGITDFAGWTSVSGKEKMEGEITGTNTDPQLVNPAPPQLTDPKRLHELAGFQLKSSTTLHDKGLDLKKLFQLDAGGRDFYGNPVPSGRSCEPGIYEIKDP
jgi:hypothetical protein